ncbi:hypothetical protein LRE75_17395 [Streptomyces sp. 372A]
MLRLLVFIESVLGFGIVIMSLVSGLMVLRHDGPSAELAHSVSLLALFLGLLLVTERAMTGRWFRWSRR